MKARAQASSGAGSSAPCNQFCSALGKAYDEASPVGGWVDTPGASDLAVTGVVIMVRHSSVSTGLCLSMNVAYSVRMPIQYYLAVPQHRLGL
jgi:hypothetical protein